MSKASKSSYVLHVINKINPTPLLTFSERGLYFQAIKREGALSSVYNSQEC